MEPQQIFALGFIVFLVVMCLPEKKKKNKNRYVPKDWIKSERYKAEVEEIQNN